MFIHENALQNVFCEMAAILFRPQYDKEIWCAAAVIDKKSSSSRLHVEYCKSSNISCNLVGNKLVDHSAVWYKTKFGSQILATNFGVFFMIYVMLSKICSMSV